MYLESLTLNGFKSFAKKTILDFRSGQNSGRLGITAIVGPNGAGKSNVADAIRWALGEQSIKLLRGKKSEDVIFAGSHKKTHSSMAEVSLKLNNDDNKLPLFSAEIELTRRLFRSGDSEYLINDQKSRLHDIALLLAKAHIGQKSYTVIGQGMIDKVLNSTPSERKEFFDEAAGIREYQIKKEHAFNKLVKSKENLKSGEMMLQEITPRLKYLQRQMKRLEQREGIVKKLENALHDYFFVQWKNINMALQSLLDKKISNEKNKHDIQGTLKKLQDRMSLLAHISNDTAFEDLQQAYHTLLEKKGLLAREIARWQGKRDRTWEQQGEIQLIFFEQRKDKIQKLLQKKRGELTTNYQKLETIARERKELKKIQKDIGEKMTRVQEKLFQAIAPENQELLENITQIKQQLNALWETLERTLQKFSSGSASLDALQKKLKAISDDLKQHIQRLPAPPLQAQHLPALRRTFKEVGQKKKTIDEHIASLTKEQEIMTTRNTAISEEIKALEREKKEVDERIVEREKHAGKDETQAQIQQRVSQLNKDIQKLDQELSDIKERLSRYNKEEQGKKRELYDLQKKSLELQQKLGDQNQTITDIEIKLSRWQTKKEDLEQSLAQELNITLSQAIAHWQRLPEHKETHDPRDLENKIQKLKRKKELIGGIDEDTMQEYDETKERYDFLTQQIHDLTKAIGAFENIIKDLDVTIENQFIESVRYINKKFSYYFKILFQGGKAELSIRREDIPEKGSEDEELKNDQTEEVSLFAKKKPRKKIITGIDIFATPPGKKLANINMLSGGEKALTSIALICAIIANNVSPFVVLDEVDAALDEANSLRFANILEELARATQFIIITHNRATMEKADLLYGVTMGDDGISKLLSIKLEEGKKYTNR